MANPYFNTGSLYGLSNSPFWENPYNWRSQYDYLQSPVGGFQALGDQEAYYTRLLGNYSPLSNEGAYLESQFNRAQLGFREALMTNPELKATDYYPGVMSGIRNQWRTMGPEQQGYNYNRYAPPAQRIPRGF